MRQLVGFVDNCNVVEGCVLPNMGSSGMVNMSENMHFRANELDVLHEGWTACVLTLAALVKYTVWRSVSNQ